MKTTGDRILTTHAGSLPRPKALTELHIAGSRGEAVDEAALAVAAEEATREVVSKQIEAGIDILNNGEAGRESFFTYVRHRMSGFGGESSRRPVADLMRYPGYLEQLLKTSLAESVSLMRAPKALARVRYETDAPIRAECEQLSRVLKEHSGRFAEAFVTAASPGIIATAMENAYYDDLETYVGALATALRTEYRTITEAGFILQIDAPDLAMERHTLFQDKSLDEFLGFVRVVIEAINGALEGISRDRVRLHVCWGNYEGPHDLDVPLADIWGEVSKARVGGFLLSMANPRHSHEYHLFETERLPEGAILVPGVIDTTTNYIEHPEAVADRIELVSNALGDPRRVIAGTDCGFETAAGFVSVAPEIVWAKLRALARGAAIASARLLGGQAP